MKIIVSHISLWAERKKTAEVFKSVSRSLIIKQMTSTWTIEGVSWSFELAQLMISIIFSSSFQQIAYSGELILVSEKAFVMYSA